MLKIGRMLDPRRVRVFRSVVASGSVQAAADNLGLTSSAVSQHLSALQQETGLTLFHRVGRGIAPTEAALVLDAQTDEVMSQWARSTSSSPTCARVGRAPVDRLLRVRRCRLDAVARQAPHQGVPRPRARARAQRGRAAPGDQADIDLVIDPPDAAFRAGLAVRPHRGPLRRRRSARPRLAEDVVAAVRPARQTWGATITQGVRRPLGRRGCAQRGPPGSRSRRRTITRRSGRRPRHGVTVLPVLAAPPSQQPSSASASPPKPVRHLAALVRDLGAPNPRRTGRRVLTDLSTSRACRRAGPSPADHPAAHFQVVAWLVDWTHHGVRTAPAHASEPATSYDPTAAAASKPVEHHRTSRIRALHGLRGFSPSRGRLRP